MNLRTQASINQTLGITIGIVYLWFGTLKFFPGMSPAEGLAIQTIEALTFNFIPSQTAIILLAIWEVLVGALLVLNVARRLVLPVTLLHMVLTFVPLFLFVDLSFTQPPYAFTLLGQYIFKNIIIIGALYTLHVLPINKK